jgi:hypothetical protein
LVYDWLRFDDYLGNVGWNNWTAGVLGGFLKMIRLLEWQR